MIAFQILGESIAAVAGGIPWLAWQWFWLRHYRCLLGWKPRTAEIIVAALMIVLSLMNDAGFWGGLFVAVIVDTCVAAMVVWRTLRCRYGQRFSQPVAPVPLETDKPRPTESDFPQTWLGWIAVSVVMGTVSYWYYGGTKIIVPTKGGKWAVPIKTEHGRRIETDRRNAEVQVKKLTDAIAKSTDPLEQANLYQQRAQAYRALGENDRAQTDEGRAQQLRSRNLRLENQHSPSTNRLVATRVANKRVSC